jgi:hypothetical protein
MASIKWITCNVLNAGNIARQRGQKTKYSGPFRVPHVYHANSEITLANVAQVIRAKGLFHRQHVPQLSMAFTNLKRICTIGHARNHCALEFSIPVTVCGTHTEKSRRADDRCIRRLNGL